MGVQESQILNLKDETEQGGREGGEERGIHESCIIVMSGASGNDAMMLIPI